MVMGGFGMAKMEKKMHYNDEFMDECEMDCQELSVTSQHDDLTLSPLSLLKMNGIILEETVVNGLNQIKIVNSGGN